MNHYRKTALTAVSALAAFAAQALSVGVLRTQYLENPVGLDNVSPRFSWQLSSDARSTVQQSYQVEIATDRNMSETVYDSGTVNSRESANVELEGLELQPSTRYYWRVTVTDNHGERATSTNPAYFETGLMGSGWSGAQWIKVADSYNTAIGEERPEVSDYVVEVDFEIEKTAAGICLARHDAQNFYMWQFNVEGDYPRFRPHRWQNGNAACLDNINLTGKADMATGTVHHMRVEVTEGGARAQTWLDGTLIDDRRGDFSYGQVGFRQDRGEKDSLAEIALFDNLKVTSADGTVLLDEDFSGDSHVIDGGVVTDGWLRVVGSSQNTVYAWEKVKASGLRYDIEADMTLINDAASIIFSHTGNTRYFMWAINTNDRDYPLVRRHVYANSTNPQFSDTEIKAFSKEELLGHERRVKIEVDGADVRTYIDGTLVDSFNDATGMLSDGLIGFRVFKGEVNEQAYWDNVKVTVYDQDGGTRVILSEDFENGAHEFSTGTVVNVGGDNKLHAFSAANENKILQDAATSSPRFRKAFALDGKVRRATLYSSALGIYNVWINGERVGTKLADGSVAYDELMPGWSDYRSSVFYMTHDVTDLVKEGDNAIGAMVSNGWWAGDVSHGIYGSTSTAFLAKLVVELETGETVTVVTDPSWQSSSRGAVKSGEIYHGEIYDARSADNWSEAGYESGLWGATAADRQAHGELMAHEGPTVRIRPNMERKPVSITVYDGIKQNGTTYGEINAVRTLGGDTPLKLKKGETAVVDFGQNASGWARFKVKGASGTQVNLRFAEMVNDSGEAERGNDDAKGTLYRIALRSAKAMGQYTLAGRDGGEEYAPTTTFYGFRYCDITATDDVEFDWITAETISTATEENSYLTVDNADVNQLYSNIVWGQRSNFVSVPTDCPQRDERLGWTADTQIFSLAASYNAQVQGFYHKWMRDMRDGQLDNGAYPNVAPFNWVEHGSCAWADAGIILPWNVYVMYGDKSIIEENYDSMVKYMDWVSRQKDGTLKYPGSDTRYGDWLAFEDTDKRYISVAHYGYMADIMGRMSKAISREEGDEYDVKAAEYAELFENIRKEFKRLYINARSGQLIHKSQCAQLLALKFNLLLDEKALEGAKTTLRDKIVANGNKLSTGFIGTGIINQTLSEFEMGDLAYTLLLQHDCPSWLYSVDQGATTIWERWNSYTREGGFSKSIEMNSFNHYAYGAVAEWMYRYMAGIAPDNDRPGFEHIILKPEFDAARRISDVDAVFGSNYGPVAVKWNTEEGGQYSYSVTVPANTTATLTLPSAPEGMELREGDVAAGEAEGVTDVTDDGTVVTMTLGSGSYRFSTGAGEGGLESVKTETGIVVIPNPCDDYVTVKGAEGELTLRSLEGVLLDRVADGNRVEMGAYPAGVYLLTADGETVKVIKR